MAQFHRGKTSIATAAGVQTQVDERRGGHERRRRQVGTNGPAQSRTALQSNMDERQSKPRLDQSASTRWRVCGSMRMNLGQGRWNPSLGHLRVASTPILEPKLGKREA